MACNKCKKNLSAPLWQAGAERFQVGTAMPSSTFIENKEPSPLSLPVLRFDVNTPGFRFDQSLFGQFVKGIAQLAGFEFGLRFQ